MFYIMFVLHGTDMFIQKFHLNQMALFCLSKGCKFGPIYYYIFFTNNLAKLRGHASRVHFAKIHLNKNTLFHSVPQTPEALRSPVESVRRAEPEEHLRGRRRQNGHLPGDQPQDVLEGRHLWHNQKRVNEKGNKLEPLPITSSSHPGFPDSGNKRFILLKDPEDVKRPLAARCLHRSGNQYQDAKD